MESSDVRKVAEYLRTMPLPRTYEAHVTIEPVFGERFLEFETICSKYSFRPAELLLQKQRKETPQRSNKDSFCTGHDNEYDRLLKSTVRLVEHLKRESFDVWRYKIEGILLDVRTPPLIKIQNVKE